MQQTMKILVIHDHALLHDHDVATQLELLGCECIRHGMLDEQLTVGSEIIAVVVQATEDVEHGYHWVQRLKQLRKSLPVLLVVSYKNLSKLSPNEGRLEPDDFIVSPLVPAELYTRLRRAEWKGRAFQSEEEMVFGDLRMHKASREVFVKKMKVTLTKMEFDLLFHLMGHGGVAHSRGALLEKVWGMNPEVQTRTVDIHVRRLRAKLGSHAAMIETVPSVGYKFVY